MGDKLKITYEVLFDMLRNERNREELQPVDREFYDDVEKYLEEKSKLVDTSDNLFSIAEAEKAKTQLLNLKKIIKEFFERREKKIINLAVSKAKTGSDLVDTSTMLSNELELYDELFTVLSKERGKTLDPLLHLQRASIVQKKEEEPEISESVEKQKEEIPDVISESEDDLIEEQPSGIKIAIKSAIPRFVGKDMNAYGPFEIGQEAKLPKEVADVLLRKEKASLIDQ